MSASVWSPDPDVVSQVNAAGLIKMEAKVANAGDRVINLTTFAYAVNTGSLIVFQNGKLLTRNLDYVEVTGAQFVLTNTAAANDMIVAVGFVGVTGTLTTDPVLRSDLQGAGGSNLVKGVWFDGSLNTVLALGSSVGAKLLGFQLAYAGSVARSISDKLSDIVHPKDFGAVGNGAVDDYVALQAMFTRAFALGYEVIDLRSGVYSISQPIVVPKGSNVRITNGAIKAAPNFPLGRDMLEFKDQSAGLVYHDIVIDNLLLDANHRASNCIQLDNYIRVFIGNGVKLLHFVTNGLWLRKSIDSHECVIAGGFWAFKYLYGEAGYTAPDPATVGIRVDSFDNIIDSVVSYYTGQAMVINGQYNLVSKPHVGGTAGVGITITENAAFTSIHQPYMDSAGIILRNPWNVEILGGKFLTSTADATFSFVVVKPIGVNIAVKGLKIKDSSFHNSGAALVNAVTVDSSAGGINAAFITQCYIKDNSFNNVKPAYTHYRTGVYQNASTDWVFDFTPYFPLGVVQYVSASFFDGSNVKPSTNIATIATNTVTARNTIAGNGTMYFDACVNTDFN